MFATLDCSANYAYAAEGITTDGEKVDLEYSFGGDGPLPATLGDRLSMMVNEAEFSRLAEGLLKGSYTEAGETTRAFLDKAADADPLLAGYTTGLLEDLNRRGGDKRRTFRLLLPIREPLPVASPVKLIEIRIHQWQMIFDSSAGAIRLVSLGQPLIYHQSDDILRVGDLP